VAEVDRSKKVKFRGRGVGSTSLVFLAGDEYSKTSSLPNTCCKRA